MKSLGMTISILLLCVNLYALDNGLALTPPMGWDSWNCLECHGISEHVIMEIADAMVESGMKDAGYEYIVIDDCWQVDRDSAGNIIADPAKFPSGIKALADYIHDKGLKFGLYSCAGTATCQNRPGSRGYEFQDARQYAAWGVDFLKYDWCNTSTQDARASYSLMRDALLATGRPIVFSMCEWGLSKPWLWAQDVGHLWRTTGDITNTWDAPVAKDGKFWAGGVRINLEMQKGLSKYAGPGHWNDPDMLEIGNGALTETEEKTHFSMWCMLAAPLFAGNDLRKTPESSLRILTNPEAIAIDQDSLGRQGEIVLDENEFEIWTRPLSGNEVAVCFFNPSDTSIAREIDWTDAIFELPRQYKIRDVWKKQIIGTTSKPMHIELEPHETLFVRLVK